MSKKINICQNNYKTFELILKAEKMFFFPEYQFLTNRKFRFDFANLENKIAIEIEGGIYTNGRHTRGSGFLKDMEKYNLAVLNGWKLLRYTPQQIYTSKCLHEIKQLYFN